MMTGTHNCPIVWGDRVALSIMPHLLKRCNDAYDSKESTLTAMSQHVEHYQGRDL